MRFVYCYQMKNDPVAVQRAAPQHAEYWRRLRLPEYVGGPFEDRSGGLIVFDAPSQARASVLLADDPFRRVGLLTDWWLKAWIPE